MSTLDKIREAIAPSDTADLASAVQEQTETRHKISQFSERGEKLARELREARAALGGLALDETADGRKRYDAALAKVERLERDLRHNSDAQAATSAKLQEIAQRITELTHADKVRTFTRLGNERQKKADKLQEVLAAYVEAYQAFLSSNQKISVAWPGIPPLGLTLGAADAERLVGAELFRLHPVGLLDKRSATAVPGAHHGMGLGAPDQLVPLSQVVAQANAAMIEKIKAVPAQASKTVKPNPADAPAIADKGAPASASLSAAEIMAMQPKRPRVTLDHRTGGDND